MPQKIKDFQCTYENTVGIRGEAVSGLGLHFPEAYQNSEDMVRIALAMKEYNHTVYAELPFCHMLEAEALGGDVNYGDENNVPRVKNYVCSSMEEVLKTPPIRFDEGRIGETLRACRALRERGEEVLLHLCGPFTILSGLMDSGDIFEAMFMEPEQLEEVLRRLGEEILRYMLAAQEQGVRLMNYADSMGGVNIVGPDEAAAVAKKITAPLLKKADSLLHPDVHIGLCPKTTLALLGTDLAEFQDLALPAPMTYGEGCAFAIGKTRFTGQMCIRNAKYRLEQGKIRAVVLKSC